VIVEYASVNMVVNLAPSQWKDVMLLDDTERLETVEKERGEISLMAEGLTKTEAVSTGLDSHAR